MTITDPVKITLEMHGEKYSAEGLSWEITGEDLIKAFKCLMISVGFPPSILDDEDGRWVYETFDNPIPDNVQ